MKTVIVSVLLVTSVMTSVAVAGPRESCKHLSDFAENVMIKRQNGATMHEMLEYISSAPDLEWVIEDAYKYPLMRTYEYKEDAVKSFSDNMFRDCYEALKALEKQGYKI